MIDRSHNFFQFYRNTEKALNVWSIARQFFLYQKQIKKKETSREVLNLPPPIFINLFSAEPSPFYIPDRVVSRCAASLSSALLRENFQLPQLSYTDATCTKVRDGQLFTRKTFFTGRSSPSAALSPPWHTEKVNSLGSSSSSSSRFRLHRLAHPVLRFDQVATC